MAPGNVAACGSVSVSWVPRQSGEPSVSVGLPASPRGKHLLTHTQSGIVFHIQTRSSWRACSGMTPSLKYIMNLTNITSLYGYPCTCCFSSNCSQNAHTVCSLEILSGIPYVTEGSLLPHFSFQRTFPKVQ